MHYGWTKLQSPQIAYHISLIIFESIAYSYESTIRNAQIDAAHYLSSLKKKERHAFFNVLNKYTLALILVLIIVFVYVVHFSWWTGYAFLGDPL